MIRLAVERNDVTLCLSCMAQGFLLKFSGHRQGNGDSEAQSHPHHARLANGIDVRTGLITVFVT